MSPSLLLKAHSQSVSQLITTAINLSLQTGFVPVSLKTATIKFLLKKPSLDPAPLDYRPISNLPFIYSKAPQGPTDRGRTKNLHFFANLIDFIYLILSDFD